jgi:hypothetical protein
MFTNEFELKLATAIGRMRGNLSAQEVMSIETIAEIIRNLSANKNARTAAIGVMAEIALTTFDRIRAEEEYRERHADNEAISYWKNVLENLTAGSFPCEECHKVEAQPNKRECEACETDYLAGLAEAHYESKLG